MKRVLLVATALVTFLSGVALSRLFNPTPILKYQFEHRRCPKREFKPRLTGEYKPLRVSLSRLTQPANSRVPYEHRYAIVENASTIPIRYYVLGFGTDRSNVGANAFMTENGFTYTYPDLSSGPLMPGESRTVSVRANAEFSEEAFVWVDYLEFEDGLGWGANKSRTPRVKHW